MSSKFSISVDTSTIVGETICAIKVKFAEHKGSFDQNIQKIENKLIGITSFYWSSDGIAYLEAVNGKVLCNDILRSYFVGLTHDNAASLKSPEVGLYGLLRKESEKSLFDLTDPCHGVDLALKSSLKNIPKRIIEFIEGIHSFFAYPQRKAQLKNLQERKKKTKLLLKDYVHTGWLSLGLSLKRLLEIWGCFEDFMNWKKTNRKRKIRMRVKRSSSLRKA